MIDELTKEAKKRQAEKQETAKQNMIEGMKKYTLRENVKYILCSLAKMSYERSLLNKIPNRTEVQKAQRAGEIAALNTACKSLKAALDNSLPD